MALARYTGVAQDPQGNVLSGATVTVRRQRSGKPLAALKTDRAGVVPKANPFLSNPDGSFFFHAVGDIYEITVSKGADSFVREYVGIGTASEYDLDALLIGKRQQVRVATTANIAISTALNAGDSIDGVTLVNGDLVLVKDQTSAVQNGIYVVGVVPARSVEFDTYDEHAAAMIAVASGTVNALALFFCTANAGGTLNTTSIDFTKLQSTAGPQGDPGPPGEDGEDGAPGAPGAPGADGKMMRHGSGAPSGALGNDDDFYIDTTNHLLYGPKAGGSWGTPTPTTAGPKGDPGDPGADGDDGDDGAPGNPGADGDDGWSPVFATETDGARRVQRVVDWVGGSGTKPATGKYVGATGFETLIANGVDIRGPVGAPGAGSGDMQESTYDPDGDGKLANAQLDDMAQGTVKMRRAGAGSGSPTDTTLADLKTDLALSNVTNVAQIPASYLDTDGTLAANSDTKVATQKAVKTAINALLGANDAEVFKGAIDCSANPNYPAADAGHVYRVSVAGKIGGASGVNVEVNDRLQCVVDSTASGNQATVGTNWWITQANIDGGVTGPASAADATPAVFDGTTGKLIKNIAFSVFKTALSLVKGDVGLGNVDNTSDATKNSASATLINKVISTKDNSITGVPDDSNASAGQIGEYMVNKNTTGVSLATGVTQNIVQVTLTAGDWDCRTSMRYFSSGGATITNQHTIIADQSATIPDYDHGIDVSCNPNVAGDVGGFMCGPFRYSVPNGQTKVVYGIARCTYASGSITVKGIIEARRVR